MRADHAINRDPINQAALPNVGGMGFDYRTELPPTAKTRSYTVYFSLLIIPTSLAITICARLTSDWLSSGFALAVLVGIAAVLSFLAFYQADRRIAGLHPLRLILMPLCVALTIWLLARMATWTASPILASGLPLAMGLALAAYCVDRVATHSVAWSLASPRLNAHSRKRWQHVWAQRFSRKLPGRPDDLPPRLDPVWEQAIEAVHAYRRCLLILAAAYLAISFLIGSLANQSATRRLFAGPFFIFLLLGILVDVTRRGPRCTIRRLTAALVNWVTYNAHGTRAPGVFRSPAGSFSQRLMLTGLSLFLLVFTLAPLAYYFPLGVGMSDPEPWIYAIERTDTFRDTIPGLNQSIGSPVPKGFLRDHLTPEQSDYFSRLPTGNAQTEFLDHLSYEYRLSATTPGASYSARVLARMCHQPEDWLLVALIGAGSFQSNFLWSLLLGLFLSAVVPTAVWLCMFYSLAGGAIETFHRIAEVDAADLRSDRATDWKCFVQRLREADPVHLTHGAEFNPREHLWLGTTVWNNYPVFLSRQILHDHAHILGDTGSGKTSLGLAPLVSQLIRSGRPDPQTGYAGHSVVIIDLKGEPPFFQGARIESRASKMPFKWFTNESRQATYIFNPLTQTAMQELTPNQRTEVLLQALGLEHGEGYGASYFSRVNRKVLAQVLKKYEDAEKRILSFRGLHELFQDKNFFQIRDRTRDAAEELLSVVENLADFDALNIRPEDAQRQPLDANGKVLDERVINQAIDMSDVIARPQVVYFYLPAAIETASVREMGKLALYCLLTAAIRHERLHGRAGRVYLVIDEFQQIVSKSLELVLRQARSKGIAMILANQSQSDLRTHDADLIPVLQTNTRFKQFFSAGDLRQQEALIEASGEALYDLDLAAQPQEPLIDDHIKWPTDIWGNRRSATRPRVDSRLNRNDIIRMSDAPSESVVHVQHGMGFTQFQGFPFLLNSGHHITRRRFLRRAVKPWPMDTQDTICTPVFRPDYVHKPADGPSIILSDPLDEDEAAASDAPDLVAYMERDLRQHKDKPSPPEAPPRSNLLPDD